MLKKNRDGKIMRKHGRIKNLDNFLKKFIEPLESVNLITPGAIKVGKGTGEVLKVRWGREVIQGAGNIIVGCKLNASSGNLNQEIYIATSQPEQIKKIIDEQNQ